MGRKTKRQQLIDLLGQFSLKDATSIEELTSLHELHEKLKAAEPEKKPRKTRSDAKTVKAEKVKSKPLTAVIPSDKSKAKIEAGKLAAETPVSDGPADDVDDIFSEGL